VKLSPNFTLAELTASDAAKRAGVENQPTPVEVLRLRRLALGLEWVRDIVKKPVRVHSAFRNEKVNALVGGVENSDHRLGLAADISVSGMTARELANTLARQLAIFDQIILEEDRGVVHISFADRYRKQVLQQLKKGGRFIPL
jgi:zinc D-Ala-D-Ala carboxypeptidase